MAVQEFTTQELASEEWRSVIGYENSHQVSSLGRVRKTVETRRAAANHILRPTLSNGYPAVALWAKGKKPVFRRIHLLVADAFCRGKQQGLTVNHKDGIKTNNRPENLEYVTQKDNIRHALRLGLIATGERSGARKHPEKYPRGESHPLATLRDAQIPEICHMLSIGVKGAVIARLYGVSPMTISNIKHRRGRYRTEQSRRL